MKEQITQVVGYSYSKINDSTQINADCGVQITKIGDVLYLGALKIPYELSESEKQLEADYKALQLKYAQMVYPVQLKEIIYNNGDDKCLYIKGMQDGIEYRCNVITTILTPEQQVKIQAFHDFVEQNIKQGFDTLQWYPPTLLKVDEITVNTDQLGEGGNDMVFIIGECLKEVLIQNKVA